MAAKNCDCIKRDVCVFYSDGDYPQVCEKCGHYIMEKGFTSTNKQSTPFIKQCTCGKRMATVHLCDECFRDAVTQ